MCEQRKNSRQTRWQTVGDKKSVFADCFCALHTHQLEFANTSLPTLVCRVKAAEEVAAALMHPQIKKFVFEELLRSLDGEYENLCRPSTQSLLRQKTVEQLPSFACEKFVDEELKGQMQQTWA